MPSDRFAAAIAAIDEVNSHDPNVLLVAGSARPKEVVHAEMLTAWVGRLIPGPSESLLLAARGHHIRRWLHPRSELPPGRGGYLRWRTGLYRFHAAETAGILERVGYDEATIARVEMLIAKRAPADDPDGQALEDGLCLVFLETQLGEVAGKLDREKMINVLRRTWRKMSPAAREHALALSFEPQDRALVSAALGEG